MSKIDVFISEEQIQKRVEELGEEITKEYSAPDKNLLLVAVLKGSVVFMADLMRSIKCKCAIDFMATSSYASGTVSSGNVKIIKDLDVNLSEYDVLIVEDILDSGYTLSKLLEILETRSPKSLRLCTLLDKPDRRKADVRLDFRGFTIPDEFVIGYGLDYDERYRNLPYIGILTLDAE